MDFRSELDYINAFFSAQSDDQILQDLLACGLSRVQSPAPMCSVILSDLPRIEINFNYEPAVDDFSIMIGQRYPANLGPMAEAA